MEKRSQCKVRGWNGAHMGLARRRYRRLGVRTSQTIGGSEMGDKFDVLERRVAKLEQEVALLTSRTTEQRDRPWWERIAGRFENDQAFDEIVRLGREYRNSLRSEDA